MIAILSWAESAKWKPVPREDIVRNPTICCGCGFVGVAIADIRASARLTDKFDQSPLIDGCFEWRHLIQMVGLLRNTL